MQLDLSWDGVKSRRNHRCHNHETQLLGYRSKLNHINGIDCSEWQQKRNVRFQFEPQVNKNNNNATTIHECHIFHDPFIALNYCLSVSLMIGNGNDNEKAMKVSQSITHDTITWLLSLA